MKPYKLSGRELKQTPSVIDIGGITVGSRELAVIAGPCAVESEESFIETALKVKEAGASILRRRFQAHALPLPGTPGGWAKIMAKAERSQA